MRKRLMALAAAAVPLAVLTFAAAPAHAYDDPINLYDTSVTFTEASTAGIQYYCLDIPSNHAVVGQQLQAYTCNGSDAQAWNKIYTDSYHFKLQSFTNPDLCANNWQGGDVSGNDIKLYYCNGNADGTWNAVYKGDKRQIQPRSALNTCLNIWGGLASGHPAKLYQCGDYSNENMFFWY